jgi:hypothetical protein
MDAGVDAGRVDAGTSCRDAGVCKFETFKADFSGPWQSVFRASQQDPAIGSVFVDGGQVVLKRERIRGDIYFETIGVYDLEDSSVVTDLVSFDFSDAGRDVTDGMLSVSVGVYSLETEESYMRMVRERNTLSVQTHISKTAGDPYLNTISVPSSGVIRMRISAPAGRVRFDAFFNGAWNLVVEVPNPLKVPLRDLRLGFLSSCYETATDGGDRCNPSTAVLDNVNVP